MPRLIEVDTDDAIDLGELITCLDEDGFDPRDEESFTAAAASLRKLANNRHFLTDIAIGELKTRCRNQLASNRYGAQVIMLHRASAKYFIRANFWPASHDSVSRASGTAPFFYGVPHDHNFSFLTVGYLGPGYWSEYYEYDHDAVTGFVGELVDLRFVERSRLAPGRTMLYRAHRDVHLQLPADEMSVSINIVQALPEQIWLDQYRFNVGKGEIAGILSSAPTEALLALSVHYGDGNALDIATHFAGHHPSDRVRFSAWRALASAEADATARAACYARGLSNGNRFVSRACARALRDMDHAGRPPNDRALLHP
ncbi:transposase [Sphingomonas cavernae]|uniref:transposase n=1 Tax=Sphingomonas cavernae TaxID=2320861 RepID=UPI0015FFD0B2|nr:transposase [Sphingomonas cavernae]